MRDKTQTSSNGLIPIVNMANIIGFFWIILSWIWVADLGRWGTFGGLYLFFATWTVEVVLEKRWKDWHWNQTKGYFCILCALFLLGILYAPWDSTKYFQSCLEHRLGLIGFGLVGLVGLNKYYNLNLVLKYMIVLAVVMIIFLISKIGLSEFIHNPLRADLLSEVRVAYINAHMQFDFFLNVCLVGIWYLLFRTQQRPTWWQVVLLSIGFVCILATVLMSEGRSGYIAAIVLVLSFVCVELWRWRKWMSVAMIAIALGVGSYGIMKHPRITPESLHNVRWELWHSALDVIEQRPVLGHGMSRAQEQFNMVVDKYTDEEYIQQWADQKDRIDAHNQYLQVTMEFGMLGLLLLLAAYIGPVVIDNRHRLLSVYLMGLCIFQSVFDMFIMSSFCLIFGVLVLMLLWMPEAYCRTQDQSQRLS